MEQLKNFEDIKDKRLQAFNRVQVAFNLVEQGNQVGSCAYLSQFNEEERVAMGLMTLNIKRLGWEQARKILTREVKFTDDSMPITMEAVH